MKKLSILVIGFVFAVSLLFAGTAQALVRVKGYIKPSTGRYVQPYFKTSPNSYKFDNYSSRGNYNPFTGKKGYVRW